MIANWAALRGFWFARSPWRHIRLIFLSRFVSAATTGMDAYAASPSELNKLDKKTCKYLRALSKGKAYDSSATESHGRSWTNAELLHKWQVLPARAEIAGEALTLTKELCPQQRTHSQWLSPKTCTCLRGCLARTISSNSGRKNNSR